MQFIITEPTKVALYSTDSIRRTAMLQSGTYTAIEKQVIDEEEIAVVNHFDAYILSTRYGKTPFGKTEVI